MTQRKYFTEFGLNMMTGYSCLLKEQNLQDLEKYFGESVPDFHIYMIGRRPRISLNPENTISDKKGLRGHFTKHIKGKTEKIPFSFPFDDSIGVVKIESQYPYSEITAYKENGERAFFTLSPIMLSWLGWTYWDHLDLEILYIGQAVGKDGSRVASQRLKGHSTLQSIYAEATHRSPDQEIFISLFTFEMNHIVTMDGTRKDYPTTSEEDKEHRDLVFQTPISLQQEINFTEAALIRYFQPQYNIEYKDTFPNYAHSSYSECYDLEINTINVELHTDDLCCKFYTENSPRITPHFCTFPLYKREDRVAIFDIERIATNKASEGILRSSASQNLSS